MGSSLICMKSAGPSLWEEWDRPFHLEAENSVDLIFHLHFKRVNHLQYLSFHPLKSESVDFNDKLFKFANSVIKIEV